MSEREAGGKKPAGSGRPAEERVVVRDKRKIDGTAKAKPDEVSPAAAAGVAEPPESGQPDSGAEPAVVDVAADGTVVKDGTVVEDGARAKPAVDEAVGDESAVPPAEPSPLGAELEALRSELDERTGDLQRVTAEYANYRKRVERDRTLVVEQATGAVLATLLPILDDLDRAREHGDLVGPFGVVAEQLTTALGKFGLTPFGEKGDRFDPTRHEAVAHQTSPDVEEATCVEVMRRGYVLGDRLLRAALVAVADPE